MLTSGNATLTSGRTLAYSTPNIAGLPFDLWADIPSCFSNLNPDKMVYIEPGQGIVASITWVDPYHGRIETSDTISFPINLAVRTAAASGPMDSATPDRLGPLHLVSVSFPLVPLSSAR